jgi:hypothetical protein
VEPQVTIPFRPDLFEALAQRVAELLRKQLTAQRFMDAEAAAVYTGVPVKTLRTKEWRAEHAVPYHYVGGKLVSRYSATITCVSVIAGNRHRPASQQPAIAESDPRAL